MTSNELARKMELILYISLSLFYVSVGTNGLNSSITTHDIPNELTTMDNLASQNLFAPSTTTPSYTRKDETDLSKTTQSLKNEASSDTNQNMVNWTLDSSYVSKANQDTTSVQPTYYSRQLKQSTSPITQIPDNDNPDYEDTQKVASFTTFVGSDNSEAHKLAGKHHHEQTTMQKNDITTFYRQSNEFSGDNLEKPQPITNQTVVSSTTDIPATYVDRCKALGDGSCPDRDTLQYCNCDDVCHIYNDCCQEFKTTHRSTDSIYKCIRMDNEDKSYKGIFVIGSCPPDFTNLTVIDKCINADIFQTGGLPVFDKSNGSNIFANEYCALCNDVKHTLSIGIQLNFVSKNVINEELRNLQNDTNSLERYKTFTYTFMVKPKMNPRYCVSRLIVSDTPECNRYTNPIFAEIKKGTKNVYPIYKNSECMWNVNDMEKVSLEICYVEKIHLFMKEWTTEGLTVFFNFGETDDPDTKEGICEIWTEEVDRLCYRFPSYANFYETVEFTIEASGNVSALTDDFLVQVGLTTISTYVVPGITSLFEHRKIHVMKAINDSVITLKAKFELVVRKRCFQHELIQIINTFIKRNITIQVNNAIKDNTPVQFLSTNASDSDRFSHVGTIDTRFTFATNFRNRAIDVKPFGLYIVCKDITLVAKKVEHKLIIVDFTCGQNVVSREQKSSVLSITSYACFSVSTVSLVPLVIVNRKLARTMTVPRTNIENVSVSMILANIVFLFGIGAMHEPMICYVLGILLQYLFLLSFVFMTIGVLSVARLVTGIRLPNTREENVKRDRLLLTILGLMIPIVCVGPSVVIDRVGPAELSPGYGQKACFPTSFPGNVAFFSGPVILLLGINLGGIIWIIVQVQRTRFQVREMLQKSSKIDDAKLYIRIIILSGLLWLIGVIAVAVDSLWLEFVFTVCCGLQGFFLSIAGLTTQEVRRKLCVSTSRASSAQDRRNGEQNN